MPMASLILEWTGIRPWGSSDASSRSFSAGTAAGIGRAANAAEFLGAVNPAGSALTAPRQPGGQRFGFGKTVETTAKPTGCHSICYRWGACLIAIRDGNWWLSASRRVRAPACYFLPFFLALALPPNLAIIEFSLPLPMPFSFLGT